MVCSGKQAASSVLFTTTLRTFADLTSFLCIIEILFMSCAMVPSYSYLEEIFLLSFSVPFNYNLFATRRYDIVTNSYYT